MHPGRALREQITFGHEVAPFLGVYDCFSASVASRYSENLFLSGFGMAAGFYGLPDVGYIAWSDMVQTAWRIRQIFPEHRLLVDIDDGYVDAHTACHVVRQLDAMGVAMVMLEDQARPRRCGHADGKQIMPLEGYIEKLEAVLAARGNTLVLARTDSSGEEIFKRVEAISRTEADVILVDGIDSMATLQRVRAATEKPILFNQIAGGKSPRLSLAQLRAEGIELAQYSTPLLFAAQAAMVAAMEELSANGGVLPDTSQPGVVGVAACTGMLNANVPLPHPGPQAVPVAQAAVRAARKAGLVARLSVQSVA
jgi:2-methylisocitrate lyase-like PEP mutase family enzyme